MTDVGSGLCSGETCTTGVAEEIEDFWGAGFARAPFLNVSRNHLSYPFPVGSLLWEKSCVFERIGANRKRQLAKEYRPIFWKTLFCLPFCFVAFAHKPRIGAITPFFFRESGYPQRLRVGSRKNVWPVAFK